MFVDGPGDRRRYQDVLQPFEVALRADYFLLDNVGLKRVLALHKLVIGKRYVERQSEDAETNCINLILDLQPRY